MPGQHQEGLMVENVMTIAQLSRLDGWVAAHPFLGEFADIHAVMEGIVNAYPVTLEVSDWEKYAADYAAGIPVLESGILPGGIVSMASDLLADFTAKLADSGNLPERFVASVTEFGEKLAADHSLGERVITGSLRSGIDEPTGEPGIEGMELFLGWTVLSRVLRSVISGFTIWRDETKWNRGYCPTCGSAPGMALLVSANNGKVRHLSCGLCQTRWSYRRIGCPFCGTESPENLEIFELEEDETLRLDVCNQCKGYLKTCTSEQQGDIALLDWTSLHLDAIAREKGYTRIGATLYGL